MTRDDGGAAFPYGGYEPVDGVGNVPVIYADNQGMTLRDYFAAKAMHAALTSEAAMQVFGADAALDNGERAAAWAARSAYDIADAMLKARQP